MTTVEPKARGHYKPLESPVIALPDRVSLDRLKSSDEGLQWLQKFLSLRDRQIRNMAADPFRYGWKGDSDKPPPGLTERAPNQFWGLTEAGLTTWRPFWRDASNLLEQYRELLIMGSNRSSKSEWAVGGRGGVMDTLTRYQKGGSRPPPVVWCFSTTEESSKRDQQPLVYKYLPSEWRAPNGPSGIRWNTRSRFADNFFVCPNGAECWFKNYRQDIETIEGGQIDLWWGDEDMPVEFVRTLRGRTVDRHGRGALTFTPVHGFTQTVAEYVTGADVMEWTPSDLFPNDKLWPRGQPGKLPYTMLCLNVDAAVIYFQARWNPFIDYQELCKKWSRSPRKDRLIRLHGLTERAAGNQFPTFGRHNIIPPESVPTDGTNYMLIDFAYRRNWYILWLRIVEHAGKKRIIAYREWPDKDRFGEWVVPSGSRIDGQRGPAQSQLGLSIDDYKRIIIEEENWNRASGSLPSPAAEKVYRRLGDPKSGAAPALSQSSENTSIIDMLGREVNGLPGLDIEPAVGGGKDALVSEGINLIRQWLEFDDSQPLSAMNEPIFYVSERCGNLIDCLKMWTGADGQSGASKDPIDMLRTAAFMELGDVGNDTTWIRVRHQHEE